MMSHQPQDSELSCNLLRDEIAYLNVEHKKKKKAHQDSEVADVIFVITGLFVIFPWFFMDFKDANKVEYEAIEHRIEILTAIARDKNCGFLYSNASEDE